ncbi:MAG: CatB-related O-acetyltransferase [Chlorobi bacterium]|nr:CatB-related O-acetyltransferase [Chlorobiota bacterium]
MRYPSCRIKAAGITKNVRLEKGVTLEYGAFIGASLIGKYTFINRYCLIEKSVSRIGRFCSIGYNVRIGLGNHPLNYVSTHPFIYRKKYGFVEEDFTFPESVTKPTIIGNDVWIGANATILAGVSVGDGAVIGANSLVGYERC